MSSVSPSRTARQWWHFVPSLLVCAGITYMSLVKDAPMPLGDVPMKDKWGHMLAYFVWTLCLANDSRRLQLSVRKLYALAILLPLVYGGLIELIQPYFPPRQGEWGDWLADAIGIVIALCIFTPIYLWKMRHPRQTVTS